MSNRSLNMLKTALDMEKKGMKFYEEAIAKCKNDLGREIFTTLKADEVVHVDRIKTIYTSIEGKDRWTDEWTKFAPGHGALKPLFRDLAKKHGSDIKAETSDIQALDVGIDFEEKSVRFYEDQLAQAEDAEERKFIEKMVGEEKDHRDTLKDMKYYLTDPAAYFAERERAGLDGA